MSRQFEDDGPDFRYVHGVALDINQVVRDNVAFLRTQMMSDRLEERYVQEHGPEWVQKFKEETYASRARKDPELYHSLIHHIREELDDGEFTFRERQVEIPEATDESVGKLTGISPSKLRRLTRGKQAITVEELLALAAGLQVSPSYLLTPPQEFLAKEPVISSPTGATPLGGAGVATSTWVLWLYSLLPLPTQDWYLFERNLSYCSVFIKRIHGNAALGKDEVIETFERSRGSARSHFKRLDDFGALKPGGRQDPAAPVTEKGSDVALNRDLIYLAMGMLFEIRKALRLDARSRVVTARGLARLRNQQQKAINFLDGVIRLLREKDHRSF